MALSHSVSLDDVHYNTSVKREENLLGFKSRTELSDTDDDTDDDFEFPDDFQGFDDLPKSYRPSKKNPYPDLIHLLLPVTDQSLLSFIDRLHSGVSLEDLGLSNSSSLLAKYIAKHLSEQRQFKIQYFLAADGVPYEADVYIHMCSNYSVEERGGEEEAKRVAEWVKEQLELDEEIKPKWYFGLEPETPSRYKKNSMWQRRGVW
ncbi:hypothetical protein EIP91_000853 [Steccherinum ochraceum]|uniref:Uncharacterized protein n=1 Tax=Steccherinum ochraceum TaxID=92696 RepID=A0A4V2MXP5_9APHY|nr:hypothetical protein EIP91_000853 [Steccherinum ochraceum]